MTAEFAAADAESVPLTAISKDALPEWLGRQSSETRAWITATGFDGALGQVALIPGPDGIAAAICGTGGDAARARHRFVLARAQSALPDGTYHITDFGGLVPEEQALGWLLAQYRFDRYKSGKGAGAMLKCPAGVDGAKIAAIAAGEYLTRDLINTPSNDMGPAELEQAARALAGQFGADIAVASGAELKAEFPLIHTVGRASTRAPRLIDMAWGTAGPSLTLVGKGVCFDTGGLNLKPGGSMGLMKKDMGGAANVLGLAHMIMALGLTLRLRVLIPAVENAVAGDAFRPGDVLRSRKGLTVEINNTDAEGRLVLADALALADEAKPDLILSMATLTGAARVAVGPDLAPFYASDPGVADALRVGAGAVADPVWEMPFHAPYESMIEPQIADLDNAPAGGFAGSITAALFLKRFVTATPSYAHFDIYGWQPSAAPGRPKGGVGQGTRAILAALPDLIGL